MNEIELVERIRPVERAGRQIELGIGDDCAIYRPRAGEDLLFTTDQMIEDVHFRASQTGFGHRRAGAGAQLERHRGHGWRSSLLPGVAGGATERREVDRGFLSRSIEAREKDQDRTRRRRSGAFRKNLLRRDGVRRRPAGQSAAPRWRARGRRDLRFRAGSESRGTAGSSRVSRLAEVCAGIATSCIDLSDGLSIDLHRLCAASGVAAEIERVPIMRGSTLDRALHGGEDYELLFTMPPGRRAPRGAPLIATARIGTMVRGKPGAIRFQGQPVEPLGYDHFRT